MAEGGPHLRSRPYARDSEALTERADVDRQLIYRTELGQTSPRMDAVFALADALGISVADLVGDN